MQPDRSDRARARALIPQVSVPADIAERRFWATWVAITIARLTSAQREMLILVYFCGMTHREVASVLELPSTSVHSGVAEAMRALAASALGGSPRR